jgi:mevalonate kinase
VDHTASSRGELIHYRRGPPPRVRAVKCPRPIKLLVALAGERGATSATVSALRARQKSWPKRYRRLFAEIGSLADEGARACARACAEGDHLALGDLMNLNHGLLAALQVSSAAIDEMVHRLRGMGALGAKLTGAGGDGGAVIGLFLEPEPAVARLSREGVRCFSCQIAGPVAL